MASLKSATSSSPTARFGRRTAPWALLYLVDRDGQRAVLEQVCGLSSEHPLAPMRVTLSDERPWPLEAVLASGEVREVHIGSEVVVEGQRVERALALPIVGHGETAPTGVLISGVSPRLM